MSEAKCSEKPYKNDRPRHNLDWGFAGGSVVKNLLANAEDTGSIPGSGRSPGGGNDNSLQYSRLEIPMNKGAF